jgi:hypothetical protein
MTTWAFNAIVFGIAVLLFGFNALAIGYAIHADKQRRLACAQDASAQHCTNNASANADDDRKRDNPVWDAYIAGRTMHLFLGSP